MPELMRELAQETGTLVRQEIDLAEAQVAQSARHAGIGAGAFGGAGIVLLFALGCLTACAIAALSPALAVWLAALIVGAVYALVAGILALTGERQISTAIPPTPTKTIETVKEDVEWARTRMSSGRP